MIVTSDPLANDVHERSSPSGLAEGGTGGVPRASKPLTAPLRRVRRLRQTGHGVEERLGLTRE